VTSPNHTCLTAAIQQEGLVGMLQDASATLTAFAPDNTSANSEYEIINVNGTTVKKESSNDGKVTVSELDNGNYFIRINDGMKVSTGKFVKK